MDRTFKIFMDFDRTISKIDVGDELFRKFGNEAATNKIISKLLENKYIR